MIVQGCYTVHEIHVKAIVNAPTLEDGTGKELRNLCLVQHLRALTAMGYEPQASFVTSLIPQNDIFLREI